MAESAANNLKTPKTVTELEKTQSSRGLSIQGGEILQKTQSPLGFSRACAAITDSSAELELGWPAPEKSVRSRVTATAMESSSIMTSKLHPGYSGLRPKSLHPISFSRSMIHSPSTFLKIQSQFHPTPPLVMAASSIRCKAVEETTCREAEATYELADINWDSLGFGLVPTDYMYMMKCPQNGTFSKGELQSFGPIQLNPSSGVLNYGQGLFEGLKAYRKEDGSILLFRPEENALRMRIGAERMCMISPTVEQFVDAVKLTVLANKRWVPPVGKGSLYIRPLLMGSGAVLGLAPAPEYTFLIFVSPVGNYFREGLAPINLIVENDFHRATPGGTGGVKTIGNYAPVLKAQSIAKAKGYSDVLYLDAVHKKYLEEVSSCNVFIVKDNTIATPAIKGTILPGITRKSIIDVARSQGYQVEERFVSVDELLDADEVFCTGTAVVVSPVGSITYLGKRVNYGNEGVGVVSQKLYSALTSLQMGIAEDKMGWTVNLD